MKLAEALQERADLNRRIEQLRYRLSNNVLVQEGEKPLEDPAALLEELESSFTRLEWLIARINLTNCAVKVEGRSLTELIARRDVLSLRAEATAAWWRKPARIPTAPPAPRSRSFPPSMSPPCSGRPMMPPASCAFWITPCRPPTGPPT